MYVQSKKLGCAENWRSAMILANHHRQSTLVASIRRAFGKEHPVAARCRSLTFFPNRNSSKLPTQLSSLFARYHHEDQPARPCPLRRRRSDPFRRTINNFSAVGRESMPGTCHAVTFEFRLFAVVVITSVFDCRISRRR